MRVLPAEGLCKPVPQVCAGSWSRNTILTNTEWRYWVSRRCVQIHDPEIQPLTGCLFLYPYDSGPFDALICTLYERQIKRRFVRCSSLTSVSDARCQRLIRKFYALHTSWLPSQMPVFSVWYGSFMHCILPDFRIRCPFSAFRTEVLFHVNL